MIHLRSIDPPWNADAGGGGRGANGHYDLHGVDGIADVIRRSPLWSDVDPMLTFLWATVGALHTGDVTNRLNLRICAGFVWAKVDEVGVLRGTEIFSAPAQPGIGQWSRCEHEHLFVCRRGDMPVPLPQHRQRSTIYAPRGEHSAKPEKAWAVIEATARSVLRQREPLSAVEIFARSRRPRWGAFGTLDGPQTPPRFDPAQERWNGGDP